MQYTDFGYELVERDIKRLKKLKSLKEDLDIFYTAHTNQLNDFGRLSCEIASTPNYKIYKDRIAVTNPFTPPSKGCRLWFVITKDGFYIRCLIYQANEESKFTKSICFKAIKDRLSEILI